MVKEELQKELKEKVKEGVKPSDIKRLKKSKSDSDLPKNNIPSAPISPTTKIKELEDKVSVLELRIDTKDRELTEKDLEIKELKKNPPNLLLTDQLKQKQQEIESLREKLEVKNTTQELDNSLSKRHQNLKDWFSQYSKNKQLDSELAENIDEASTEIVNQDKVITNLRSENNHLKLTNQSLQRDLKLTSRLAELRKVPLPNNNSPLDWKLWLNIALGITVIYLLFTPR